MEKVEHDKLELSMNFTCEYHLIVINLAFLIIIVDERQNFLVSVCGNLIKLILLGIDVKDEELNIAPGNELIGFFVKEKLFHKAKTFVVSLVFNVPYRILLFLN